MDELDLLRVDLRRTGRLSDSTCVVCYFLFVRNEDGFG